VSEAPEKLPAGRRTIEISHPSKVVVPGERPLTKIDLARYYAEAGRAIAPYVTDRAIHVRTFPDGIDGDAFVQKSLRKHYPDWISRAILPRHEGGEIEQIVSPSSATLAYLAGQNAVSVHAWLSRVDRPENPDQLIFDLDPSSSDFGQVRSAATIVHDVLAELGLPAFLKVTGSRGLHVLTPLDRAAPFEEVRPLAARIARVCARLAPGELTVEFRKEKRQGRLFVDWLRNGYAQTAVAPLSVRARPGAPVAMPIEWSELASTAPRSWTVRNAPERLAAGIDPWRGLRARAHGIGATRAPLERLDPDGAD
jgi:bifunctional non-homologous end joining protein LigD